MFYRGTYYRDICDVITAMRGDEVRVSEVTMLDGTTLVVDLDDPVVTWMVI